MSKQIRVGVLSGGGDCPGTNALVRALVLRGVNELGYQLVGLKDGFRGLIEPEGEIPLTVAAVRGLLPRGGSILGTSRADPFRYPVEEGGRLVEQDLSDRVLQRVEALGLEGVVALGGVGTLTIAHRLSEKGLKILGCPKTLDNDMAAVDLTFGFETGRLTCMEAVDRLRETGESGEQVRILEVVGRRSGLLALEGGLAGGADIILMPEIPYSPRKVAEEIRRRHAQGMGAAVIVIAEGATAVGEVATPGPGAGHRLADALREQLQGEVTVTALSPLMRSASPTAADRIVATAYGSKALDLVAQGKWGQMVVLSHEDVVPIPLARAQEGRQVDPQHLLVQFARSMGASLGD